MNVIHFRKLLSAIHRRISERGKKWIRRSAVHHDLDGLAGRWSEAEAVEFDRAIAGQRGIDAEFGP